MLSNTPAVEMENPSQREEWPTPQGEEWPCAELEMGSRAMLPRTASRSDARASHVEVGTAKHRRVLCVVTALVAGGILLIMTTEPPTQPPSVQPLTWCMVGDGQTRWPLFKSAAHLIAHDGWTSYLRSVYGELTNSDVLFPLCIGELWMLYAAELPSHGIGDDLPRSAGECPSAVAPSPALAPSLVSADSLPAEEAAHYHPEGKYYPEGQYYAQNSRLQPANVTWIWHPPSRYVNGFGSGERVEVIHQGGLSDEHLGAWFLYAKGSGIFLTIGRTAAFPTHEDAYRAFNVTHVQRDQRNEAMCAAALAAGFDTIQFTRHTCPPMYGACTHKSIGNITGLHSATGEEGGKGHSNGGGNGGGFKTGMELLYMNLEIVATKLQGVYACASRRGNSPLLTTGWQGTRPCTCDNNASAFLNCAEVPASGRLVVEPSYQQQMMAMTQMRMVNQ